MGLRDRLLRSWPVGLVLMGGCGEEMRAHEEHAVLAGSFVTGDSAALRTLLHADFIVQPPAPDSARQGAAARSYLLQLAANTKVTESQLHPQMVVPEGPFAFEEGTWELRVGDRRYRSPYMLRWRTTPSGWRVVLWRWGRFQ
jgi:hypothetical protein